MSETGKYVALVITIALSMSMAVAQSTDVTSLEAYVDAIKQPHVADQISSMEHFLAISGTSNLRLDALEILVVDYEKTNNSAKAVERANDLLNIDGSNPLAVAVLNENGAGTSSRKGRSEEFNTAKRGLSNVDLLHKPEGISQPEFARLQQKIKGMLAGAIGIEYLDQQDYDKATNYLRQAVAADPESARYNYGLAQALLSASNGRTADAYWLMAKAVNMAKGTPNEQQISQDALRKYRENGGSEAIWNQLLTAAAASSPSPVQGNAASPSPANSTESSSKQTSTAQATPASTPQAANTQAAPSAQPSTSAPIAGSPAPTNNAALPATNQQPSNQAQPVPQATRPAPAATTPAAPAAAVATPVSSPTPAASVTVEPSVANPGANNPSPANSTTTNLPANNPPTVAKPPIATNVPLVDPVKKDSGNVVSAKNAQPAQIAPQNSGMPKLAKASPPPLPGSSADLPESDQPSLVVRPPFTSTTPVGPTSAPLPDRKPTVPPPPVVTSPIMTAPTGPVSLGILIQTELLYGNKREAILEAMREMARNLRPGDEAFLMAFSDQLDFEQDLTENDELLEEGLENLQPRPGAALFEGMTFAVQHLTRIGKNGNRVLLIISDGRNIPSKNGPPHLDADVSHVRIDCIGLDVERPMDRQQLQKLAYWSGGMTSFVSDPEQIRSATSAMARTIVGDGFANVKRR